MTVYIEKPALNLRSELASLRNQGGYQEQQFYFDSLVTNGTFDSNISGWSATSTATLSLVSNRLRIADNGGGGSNAYQAIPVIIGSTYVLTIDFAASTNSSEAIIGISNNVPTPSVPISGSIPVITTIGYGTYNLTFVPTSPTVYVSFGSFGADSADFDNISVFTSDGTDIIHTMPKGWEPKDVFEDGLLQREGALNDYEVIYDGFDYVIKPTVAPSATTQTCVIGVKA